MLPLHRRAAVRRRTGPVRRTLRLLALGWLAVTLAATVALWRENPLTHPFAERTEAEIAVALDAALARTVDRPWLDRELAAAVAAEDHDRTESLLRLADLRGIEPPDRAAAEAALDGADVAGVGGRLSHGSNVEWCLSGTQPA